MATKQAKKKPAPTPPAGSGITDLDHEDVLVESKLIPKPQEVEGEELDPEKVLQLTISKQVKRFNLAESSIEEMKKEYGALTIAGVDDKDGYTAVKVAWRKTLTVRTSLEKKGKEIRADFTAINKAVSAEENRLIGLVTPLEEQLEKLWKDIDAAKEQAERDREKAEQDQLMARLRQLQEDGMAMHEGFYSIGETVSIDVATLRSMPEDQFVKFRSVVQAKAAEIKAAKEEADRVAKEQRDKFQADQKKLKEQQEALEKEQEDLAQQKRDLLKLKQEAAKMKLELRVGKLEALGMSVNQLGSEIIYDNTFNSYRLKVEDVALATDEDFIQLVATAKTEVARCRDAWEKNLKEKEAEKLAVEAKNKLVAEKLHDAGLAFDYSKEHFHFTNDFTKQLVRMDEAVAWSAEDLNLNADNIKRAIDAAIKQQTKKGEDEKAQQELERQAKLSDSDALAEYLQKVIETGPPKLKSAHYKKQLGEFLGKLTHLVAEYLPEEGKKK